MNNPIRNLIRLLINKKLEQKQQLCLIGCDHVWENEKQNNGILNFWSSSFEKPRSNKGDSLKQNDQKEDSLKQNDRRARIDNLNDKLSLMESMVNNDEDLCFEIAMLIDKEYEACQLAEVSNRIRIPSEIQEKIVEINSMANNDCQKMESEIIARCKGCEQHIKRTIHLCLDDYDCYTQTDYCYKYQTSKRQNNTEYRYHYDEFLRM